MFNVGQDINYDQIKDAINFCKEMKAFIRKLSDSGLYRIYSESGLTDEEKSKSIKLVRNMYLKDTDFTQAADAPYSDEEKESYAKYRKYLRDFPKSKKFPENYPLSYEEWI